MNERLPLFDDDSDANPKAGCLVRRSTPLGQSKKERAVSRLLAQVQSLRDTLKEQKRRLDDALIFHAAQIAPRAERVLAVRTEVVRVLARFLDDRRVVKADQRVLRVILVEQLDEILAGTEAPGQELRALFERLNGVGFDEAAQDELDEARFGMAAVFEAMGLDVEVPGLRPGMTDEELAGIAAQMADRIRQAEGERVDRARAAQDQTRAARRTARRTRGASPQDQYWRHLQASGQGATPGPRAGSCGARAKERPDAGRHRCLRGQRSAQPAPSRVRVGRRDDGANAARRTDETLNAYAELLRQQAAQLRVAVMELPLQPRYLPLMDMDDPFGGPCPIDGPAEVQRLEAVLSGLRAGLARLSDDRLALQEVRDLIRMHRKERGRMPRRRGPDR